MRSRGAARPGRGAVLAQVLVAAVVLSLLCALILRARLAPALTAAKAVDRIRQDLGGQAALNLVSTAWLKGGACASDPELGVSCSGAGCACVCSVAGGGAVVAAPLGGGSSACAMTARP